MVEHCTRVVLACLLAASTLLLASCATPSAQLQNALNAYKQRPLPQKALALGSAANGAWVAGWIFSQPTLDLAKEKALTACRERALVAGGGMVCRVVYENDNFIEQSSTAAINQQPQPAREPAPPSGQAPPPAPSKEPEVGTGSGTFISSSGLILTAEHVVRDSTVIEVLTRDGTRARARVVAMSRNLDVAVLSVDVLSKAHFPLRVNKPVAGVRVFTVGFPVPGVLGQEPKVSEGIISAASGIRDEASFMQMSIPIQPGNSGGPVITESGELIGVVTSSAAIAAFLRRTGTIPQNVNWAARSSLAVSLVGQEGLARPPMSREAAIREAVEASVLIIATK